MQVIVLLCSYLQGFRGGKTSGAVCVRKIGISYVACALEELVSARPKRELDGLARWFKQSVLRVLRRSKHYRHSDHNQFHSALQTHFCEIGAWL